MGGQSEQEQINDNVEDIQGDSATFEDVMDKIGHFGRYQLSCFILMSTTGVGAGMSMLYFIFSNALPEWRCMEYEGSNATELARNTSWVRDMSQCTINTSLSCKMFEFNDELRTIVTDWDLLCDMKYVPKMTVTAQFVGLLIGNAISGDLADKFGRKWTGIVFNVFLSFSNLLVGFSPNWIYFSVFRALVGFFAAGTMSVFAIFPPEIVGPKWRVLVTQLEFFGFGHILMSLLAMWLRDWRHLAWVIACIPVPFLILVALFVPEPPRWLIQKKKFREATKVVERIAHNNGRTFTDMDLIPRVYASEAEEAVKLDKSTYFDLFRGKITALTTIVLGFYWFSICEMYYGIIVMISSFPGSMFVNSIIAVVCTYPLRWISLPIMTWLRRKTSLIIYGVLTVVFMFLIICIYGAGVSKDSYWITGMALIGKAIVVCVWDLTGLLTVEVVPTLMRSKGLGAASIAGRLGGMLAPQVALLGMLTHWTLPYIVHGVLMSAATLLVVWILPETSSKPLPEHTPGHEVTRRLRDGDAEITRVTKEQATPIL